jgi:hypothetical protein
MSTDNRLLFVQSDGTLNIGRPAPKAWAALIGSGGLIRASDIEHETAKQVLGGIPEAVARRWANACVTGGLSETEALELLRDRDASTDTARTVFVKDADLPTDRYFRDSWEWSD